MVMSDCAGLHYDRLPAGPGLLRLHKSSAVYHPGALQISLQPLICL
jgi:hypothetical protein